MGGEPTKPEINAPVFRRTPANTFAAFSDRRGGASCAPFDSLNAAFGIGDDPKSVTANRRRFALAAGFDLRRAVQAVSDDGARIYVVGHQDVGRGAWATDPTLVAEGLLTEVRSVPLLVAVADALPVYLAALDGRAIGIVRVGWRNLIAGALQNAVRLLGSELGVAAEEVCAAVGPSIGPCCYYVREDVGHSIGARFGDCVVSGAHGTSVDLRRAAAAELARLGVPEPTIGVPCTRCGSDRFFSARAAGPESTGRQIAALWRGEAEARVPEKYHLRVL